MVGGYVAAWKAGGSPMKHGLALGALGVILGAVVPHPYPAWYNALGFTLTIPCAVLGAHLKG
jgi:hypothetical protein